MYYNKINLLTSISSPYDTYTRLSEALNQNYNTFVTATISNASPPTLSIKDAKTNNTIFSMLNNIMTVHREVGNVSGLQKFGDSITDSANENTFGSIKAEYNYPTELILISKTSFAITLSPIDNAATPGFKKPGIIVFAKTVSGNIAVIQPSYMLGAGMNTDVNPNGLSCLTRNSTGENYSFTSILYQSSLTYQTVISPVMVNGDSDYCETIFWVPMIQFEVERSDDAILEIAGEYYYYNGFLACKIGE